MLLEKSYTPLQEKGVLGLKHRFGEALRRNDGTIDGFNTFTGTLDIDAYFTRYGKGAGTGAPMGLHDTEWLKLWELAGADAPGGLPEGSYCLVMIQPPQGREHGRIALREVARHSTLNHTYNDILFATGSEPNTGTGAAQASFTAVIVPDIRGLEVTVEEKAGFSTPDLVTRGLLGLPPAEGKPKEDLSLSMALKRAVGLDSSPQNLGRQLLVEYKSATFGPGEPPKCAALVGRGADLEQRNNDGYTVLMLAVMYGHADFVRLLLEKGAKTGAQAFNKKGDTALTLAEYMVTNNRNSGTNPALMSRFETVAEMVRAATEKAAAIAPPEPEPIVTETTNDVRVRRPIKFRKPEQ
ncbi:MAG: ankyrin repeat domain-containing protein [Alphaproteobacteria bacterium]